MGGTRSRSVLLVVALSFALCLSPVRADNLGGSNTPDGVGATADPTSPGATIEATPSPSPLANVTQESPEQEPTCIYVTDPNGNQHPCVNGKPPFIRENCDDCIPYGADEVPPGRFPFEVSKVQVQADPKIAEFSTVTLKVKTMPRLLGTNEPVPPILTVDGVVQPRGIVDRKSVTYRVFWSKPGIVWLTITDFPNDLMVPINVAGRAAKSVAPDLHMGFNQWLDSSFDGPGETNWRAWISADAITGWKPGKPIPSDSQVRVGSANVVTGGVVAPGQPREEDFDNPAVDINHKYDVWHTYPAPAGTVVASYSAVSYVKNSKGKYERMTVAYLSEPIPIYQVNMNGVRPGPLAMIPAFALARAVMGEGESCQDSSITFSYSGDSFYVGVTSEPNPIKICPDRRASDPWTEGGHTLGWGS